MSATYFALISNLLLRGSWGLSYPYIIPVQKVQQEMIRITIEIAERDIDSNRKDATILYLPRIQLALGKKEEGMGGGREIDND